MNFPATFVRCVKTLVSSGSRFLSAHQNTPVQWHRTTQFYIKEDTLSRPPIQNSFYTLDTRDNCWFFCTGNHHMSSNSCNVGNRYLTQPTSKAQGRFPTSNESRCIATGHSGSVFWTQRSFLTRGPVPQHNVERIHQKRA